MFWVDKKKLYMDKKLSDGTLMMKNVVRKISQN